MYSKIISYASLALLAATVSLTACKRDKTNDVPTTDNSITEETGYADDQAKTDQIFDETERFSDQAAEIGNVQLKGGNITLSGCATVTRDTVSVPHTITISFGSTYCLCADGRYRKGDIVISYSGHYRDSGYTHAIGFNNYWVDSNHVYGSKTVTNMGHNSAGHSYFHIVLDGHIIDALGDTISHTATRTRIWVAGESTSQISDDAYEITGSGTLVRASGKSYAINITSPLHTAMNCNWIESGTVSITPQGASSARVLDYGNGNCDDHATITVNGHTKNIILR